MIVFFFKMTILYIKKKLKLKKEKNIPACYDIRIVRKKSFIDFIFFILKKSWSQYEGVLYFLGTEIWSEKF